VNGRSAFHQELEWLVPGAVLTTVSAAFALAEIPNYAGILPALLMLPEWMIASAAMAGFVIISATFGLMRKGVEHPISYWGNFAVERHRTILFVSSTMLLTGFNMITFMWIKPLLNYLVPFWADPYLASIDHAIFRTDPWRLLSWLNDWPLALFYHRAWFALMILTLLMVLWAQPSKEKSSVMITYFCLWSLFGPIIHVCFPAAGPIFYARMGYGTAFSGLVSAPETTQLADYLWRIYSGATFGSGSGISAMPSLHIATTVWMVLAVYLFARRWLIPMALAAILIFLLSVSLGWHYAIDGIIGGGGAVAIWYVARLLLSRDSDQLGTHPFAARL
jgi:hypothetical protein